MNDTARSERTTWTFIFLMVMFILLKGFFVYFLVGDKGQPGWDYRPVPDVPGESPYAIYEPLPYPQHVRGRMGR